jgi:nitrate reductase gamma subunit
MNMLLSCLAYLAGAVFLAGSAFRAVKYARTPVPLRWELYPIPAGAAGQIRYTLAEVLLLRGVWQNNRKLWFSTYPFHMGIYLCAVSVASLVASVAWFTEAAALAGLVLLLAGACALLAARLFDPALKPYTSPADLFNLGWFAAAAGVPLAAFALEGAAPAAIWRAVFTFHRTPPLASVGVALAALLAAYIPFTHMAHFVAKYFAYHKVRWDDHKDPAVAAQLLYTPHWSASHVGADGKKTWVDVAMANPAPANPAREKKP